MPRLYSYKNHMTYYPLYISPDLYTYIRSGTINRPNFFRFQSFNVFLKRSTLNKISQVGGTNDNDL